MAAEVQQPAQPETAAEHHSGDEPLPAEQDPPAEEDPPADLEPPVEHPPADEPESSTEQHPADHETAEIGEPPAKMQPVESEDPFPARADEPESLTEQHPAETAEIGELPAIDNTQPVEYEDPFPARPFTPALQPLEEEHEAVKSSEPAPVTPEEVLDMARYLGLDVRTEYDLLWIAKQAVTCTKPAPLRAMQVIAPLPRDWDQFVDEDGNIYFHSRLTNRVSRQHPSDRFFLDQIKEERQLKWQRLTALQAQGSTAGVGPESGKSPWIEFVDQAGASYYYNVLTDEIAQYPLEGIAQYPLEGDHSELGVKAPQPSPRTLQPGPPRQKKRETEPLALPAALAYKSWYNERGQKHYMDVLFYPETGTFHVIVQRGIAFDLPQVCGLGGKPLEAWDLYVGAKLTILGKPTILKQCDCATGEWNQSQQKRLLAERAELEVKLRKFVVVPERPVKLTSGSKPKGSCHLRVLLKENLALRERLAHFDPIVLLTLDH